MSILPYQFSKFLSFAFYKNYTMVDGWKDLTNDFIESANDAVDVYEEYRKKANKQIIGSTVNFGIVSSAEEEYFQAKKLKDEWIKIFSKFAKLENYFVSKYQEQINFSENFLKNIEDIRLFLAEYLAYEKMQATYESLLNYEETLNNFIKKCDIVRAQEQPGAV